MIFSSFYVISTKEKSPLETRQRLDPRFGVTCEDLLRQSLSLESPSSNDKLDGNILMKMTGLAPIEVEILLWRGSPQKIATDSGISS